MATEFVPDAPHATNQIVPLAEFWGSAAYSLAGRLAARFDDMLKRGFLDEVRGLRARGDLHAGLPSMRLIGYRQLWQHLDGALALADASEKAVVATRQLARRQLTWLRAEPRAEWFDAGDARTAERIAARVAEWLEKQGFAARRC